jgi:hypothetical protein
LADPADLVREACTLLAGYFPQLPGLAAEPAAEGPAPGMHGRGASAPVPGDPQAFFAYTSIQSSARWAEELLLYAVGASKRDVRVNGWGGSDDRTLKLLTEVIPKLAAGAGDDAFRLIMSEMDQRLDETKRLRAIDEARQWRPLPSRACPYCGFFWLRGDMDARPPVITCWLAGCPGDSNGARPVATIGTDEHGVPCLRWPDLTETVPDFDG